MADYNQPDYVEKRVRYFDGQFLKDQDFVDEQKYLIDRQRRYHRFLNISGIVDGLAVKVKPGTTDLVTVDPGTALDNKGRQIVLSDLGPETDRQIPLQSLRGATADLVIIYNEEGSDQAQAGSAGFTRFYEKPQLTTVPSGQTAPDGAVTLARLTISGTGGVEVNNTVRIYAGVCMPYDGAGPGAGPTLRAGSTSRLDVTGDLTISGNVGIGTTTPKGFQVVLPESSKGGAAPGPGVTIAGGPNGNAGIELRNNGSGTPFIDFAQAGTGTDYDARIRLTAPGKLAIEGANVGIGTTDPGAFRLKVEGGDTSLGGALTVNGALNLTANNELVFADNGQIRSLDNAHRILFRRSEDILELREFGNIVFSPGATAGNATEKVVILASGNVGVGTPDPGAFKLKVVGDTSLGGELTIARQDTIAPHRLNLFQGAATPDSGFLTFGDGSGWKFHVSKGSDQGATKFLTIQDNGNIGIGITSPDDKLDVAGNLRILTGSNPIRFTSAWSGFPDGTDVTNQAEISNDTNGYKTLMIIGNKSNDKATRRVSVWDRLEVNGTLHVNGTMDITSNLSVASGKAVTGIPIIDFQSQTIKFQDHSRSQKVVDCTFTFSRPVEKAEAMLRSWSLSYQNREFVKEAQVACIDAIITDNTVLVQVLFGLKDASGDYDDPYSGFAQVVVIAKLSQTV